MIEFRPISLADQVHQRLETFILNGTYKKGEILSEQRLSNELGVSRTPIREALKRLTYENLLKETSVGNEVVGISLKDVEELFNVKMRIEILAVRKCVDCIDKEGIKEFQENIEKQEFYAQKGDAEKVRDLDTEFHDLIYKYSGSVVYQAILSPIHHKLMKYRQASLEIEDRIMDSAKEHREIYENIKRANYKEVEKLMLEHMKNSHDNIIEVTERRKETLKQEEV